MYAARLKQHWNFSGAVLCAVVFALAVFTSPLPAQTPHTQPSSMSERFLFSSLGWVTSRAGDDYYPAEISDALVEDWKHYTEYMQEVGFTAVGPWGFLCNTFPWPLRVDAKSPDGQAIRVTSAKTRQAGRIMDACRTNKIRFYYGLCLYFAYWQDYLSAVPDAGPDTKSALCPSFLGNASTGIPGSTELMKQAIDFVMATTPVDGFALESFHHGRCRCSACLAKFPDTPRGTAEYHRFANLPIFEHIRSKYPGVKILFCPEGPIEVIQRTENLDILKETLKRVDCFVWCGAAQPPEVMKELAAACPNVAFMLRQEPWQSVPPPASDRDGWFFPNLLHPLGETIHDRAASFSWAGVAGCGLGKENPCDNVNLRFLAEMQIDPSREPLAVLRGVLQKIYAPKDEETMRVLVSVFDDSERSFREQWRTWFLHIDFMPKGFKFDAGQAVEMVNAYQIALARLRGIKDQLGNQAEATRLETSIVKWIGYIKDQLRKEYAYAMP